MEYAILLLLGGMFALMSVVALMAQSFKELDEEFEQYEKWANESGDMERVRQVIEEQEKKWKIDS